MLAQPLAERVGGVESLVRGSLGTDDLHERHQRRRVEEMHPDHALGSRGRPRNLGDREGRGVRGQNRVGTADLLQLAEQLPLGVELLDDGLDHDVAVSETGDLGRQRQQPDLEGVDLPLLNLAREEVLDPAACGLPQLVGHLAPDGLEPRLHRELRDARAHRSQTDDSDLHAAEPTEPSVRDRAPPARAGVFPESLVPFRGGGHTHGTEGALAVAARVCLGLRKCPLPASGACRRYQGGSTLLPGRLGRNQLWKPWKVWITPET